MIFAAVLCLAVAPAFCSTPALQDWEFNVNGTDYYPAGGATLSTVPGLNSSAFNATTGLGTLTLTFDPGTAGSYYVGAWFFDPASVPFYNEYGVVNGTPASGQTWQIDIPEYDATSANIGSGTIIDNLAAETLDDTNTVPGTLSNYLFNCGANGGGSANPDCNDLVSMAQGFNFTLTAGEEEVITLSLSLSNPGGFTTEEVHPVDGHNTSATDVFYSGSAATESAVAPPPPPPPTTVPEPSTWVLLAMGVVFLAGGARRLVPNN
jgi:hypothetical protein